MREHLRYSDCKILSATVSRVANQWFISINVELEIGEPEATGPAIGVDVGIKELAVVSDGRTFDNPKSYTTNQKRLRLYQKSVSRKKKGSSNRKKAIRKLQRFHCRIANIRSDALHKCTSAITKAVSVIGIEDLNVSGMVKNHKLAKAISDSSLSELLRQIEYKAEAAGIKIVKADRFFPSSKTCSDCGCIKSDLKLSDRIYKCTDCGLEIDRDLNAAINLKTLAAGSAVLAYRPGSADLNESSSETTGWVGSFHKDGTCHA